MWKAKKDSTVVPVSHLKFSFKKPIEFMIAGYMSENFITF